MNKSTGIIFGAAVFFAGVICGFFLSPIKKGIYIGNNSGNNCGSYNSLPPLVHKEHENDLNRT